jgi:hypothetical protein
MGCLDHRFQLVIHPDFASPSSHVHPLGAPGIQHGVALLHCHIHTMQGLARPLTG